MLRYMSKIGLALATLASFSQTPMNAAGSRYSLTIHNDSQYSIYRIYLSSSESDTWIDQLGSGILLPGHTFTITDIQSGEYDVKLEDEHGCSCRIMRVDIFENKSWKVTGEYLDSCAQGSREGWRTPSVSGNRTPPAQPRSQVY
jgi:hypothetical protein